MWNPSASWRAHDPLHEVSRTSAEGAPPASTGDGGRSVMAKRCPWTSRRGCGARTQGRGAIRGHMCPGRFFPLETRTILGRKILLFRKAESGVQSIIKRHSVHTFFVLNLGSLALPGKASVVTESGRGPTRSLFTLHTINFEFHQRNCFPRKQPFVCEH